MNAVAMVSEMAEADLLRPDVKGSATGSSYDNKPLQLAESDEDGPSEDTEQVKRIKEIYKMDGTLIEETDDLEDDDEKKRRREGILKPAYSKPNDSVQLTPQAVKQSWAADYQAKATETMTTPASSLNRQAYVCLPGSKSACGTCPVYSFASRPGMAERFNELRAELGKPSYFGPKSLPLR